MIKHHVKRGIQHFAATLGHHARTHKESQLLILMYHRVLPVNDPRCQYEEPGMIVTPETFSFHLDIISERMTFIHLSDWVQRNANGLPLPRMSCAVTFDDGWADNYEYAYPVLEEKSVPATIYLVSDLIGTTRQFWPERLARLLSKLAIRGKEACSDPAVQWLNTIKPLSEFAQKQPTQEEISQFIKQAKIFNDEELHAKIDMTESVTGFENENTAPSLLNWSQLQEMTDSGIVATGSHTRNHIRLNNQATDETLSDEIISSKNIIAERTGSTVDTFCFPNGDFCERSLKLVRQNYKAAVVTSSGWNNSSSDHHRLKRIGIHQDAAYDKTAFLAKISGWL